jgi:alpha-galactosidase
MAVNYVAENKQKAIAFAYDIHPRFNEKIMPLKVQGLDPTKTYRVEEINLMPGTKSTLLENGKTFTGGYLMQVGLNVFTYSQLNSRVITLTTVD